MDEEEAADGRREDWREDDDGRVDDGRRALAPALAPGRALPSLRFIRWFSRRLGGQAAGEAERTHRGAEHS